MWHQQVGGARELHSRVCQIEQHTAKMAEGEDHGLTSAKCEFSINSVFEIRNKCP